MDVFHHFLFEGFPYVVEGDEGDEGGTVTITCVTVHGQAGQWSSSPDLGLETLF